MTETLFGRALRGGRSRWAPQLRLLGVVPPFAVALVCSYVDLSILLLAWLPFLLGVLGAAILRSWWALLAIPLALAIGTIPSIVFSPEGLHPADPGFVAGTALFVFLALVPVTIGAAIGVPLGHELEQLVRDEVRPARMRSRPS